MSSSKSVRKTLLAMVVTGLVMGCAAAGSKIDPTGPETARRGEAEMKTMMSSRTLSVSIRCSPDKVYEFVTDPQNLPKWAQGLGQSVRKQGPDWIVDTPQGPMKIRFADQNQFGVMDHTVTTPTGFEVYVPIRVLANGSGSEVIFTLFRLPDMTDEKYAEDMRLVEGDLRALKDLLEK
jgi:hypothetical protein